MPTPEITTDPSDETAQPLTDPRPSMRADAEARGMDPTLIERFMQKTSFNPTTGCLNWTAAKTTAGYGALSWKGKVLYAHHVAYEIGHGPLSEGLIRRHRCKQNPGCVNPRHLRSGTHAENMADAVADGTAGKARAWSLTDRQIAEVVGFHIWGWTAAAIRKVTGISITTINAIKKGKHRPDAVGNELDRQIVAGRYVAHYDTTGLVG